MAEQSITAAGEKLSSIVRNRIEEYFRKYNTPDSDVYNVFSASDNSSVAARVNGIVSHFSVAYGIQEYINNYCYINLNQNGYAQGVEIGWSLQNATTVGLVDPKDLDFFPLFMMPMTLRPTETGYITDKKEGMEKFLRTILLWLSVPFITAKSHYLDDKFYFDIDLVFGFGPSYDEIDNTVDKVLNKFDSLISQGNVNHKVFWDVLGSAIVDFINLNEVYSSQADVGVGAVYANTMSTTPVVPLLPPALGYTEGAASFGTDYYVNLDMTIVPSVLEIPDMKQPYSVKVNPNFPSITYDDLSNGSETTIDVNIPIDKIEGSTTDILDNLTTKVKQSINKESNFLYMKLTNDSKLSELEIVNYVVELMRTLENLVNPVVDYLISNIGTGIENATKLMTRTQRIVFWGTSLITIQPYGYSIYLEEILPAYIDAITNINTSITDIVNSVDGLADNLENVGIQSIIEITSSKSVNSDIQPMYFPNDEDVFSYDDVESSYESISALVLLVQNAVKIVAESKKTSNNAALIAANSLLATIKLSNETNANNPSTAAAFAANETSYSLLKESTPLPQSDVNSSDPDYGIQNQITSSIENAFSVYANGIKTTITTEVNSIDPSNVLERLKNNQGVFDL